jgi:hypothetical protein
MLDMLECVWTSGGPIQVRVVLLIQNTVQGRAASQRITS